MLFFWGEDIDNKMLVKNSASITTKYNLKLDYYILYNIQKIKMGYLVIWKEKNFLKYLKIGQIQL